MRPGPNNRGYFGPYGGRFVPDALVGPLTELDKAYRKARRDRAFQARLDELLASFVGRPTPLTLAHRLSAQLGGAKVWLKREDLCHTGSHHLNNAVAQVLLAKVLGKERILAEAGGGQHGVATATAAALLGMSCTVFMGAQDIRRQRLTVEHMVVLGAEIVAVESGGKGYTDAFNEALRAWASHAATTHYVIGSVLGPHPYPMMVRDFQTVIGREILSQLRKATKALPDLVVACVGGGSNAAGSFTAFIPHTGVRLVGVEAGGRGSGLGEHAAPLSMQGSGGVLHGAYTCLLQDTEGRLSATHSVAAGLDYPAVGPEHAFWRDRNRVIYTNVSDAEAITAYRQLAEDEGIIPSLEAAHALAYAVKVAPAMPLKSNLVITIAGRGEKDMAEVGSRREGQS